MVYFLGLLVVGVVVMLFLALKDDVRQNRG